MKRELIRKGDTAINGYVFTERDCEKYNRIQKRINIWDSERGYIPETLLDESHKIFCLITGMKGV